MEIQCKECGSILESDEIAIYRRIVNRNASDFLCVTCLAKEFSVSEELVRKKIVHFKEMGCTLFQ